MLTLAADVFSLGRLLFEGLTGRPAFDGDAMGTDRRVAHAPPPRSQLGGQVPAELGALIVANDAAEPNVEPPGTMVTVCGLTVTFQPRQDSTTLVADA